MVRARERARRGSAPLLLAAALLLVARLQLPQQHLDLSILVPDEKVPQQVLPNQPQTEHQPRPADEREMKPNELDAFERPCWRIVPLAEGWAVRRAGHGDGEGVNAAGGKVGVEEVERLELKIAEVRTSIRGSEGGDAPLRRIATRRLPPES